MRHAHALSAGLICCRPERRCLHQLQPGAALKGQKPRLKAFRGIHVLRANACAKVLRIEAREALNVLGPKCDVLNQYHASPNGEVEGPPGRARSSAAGAQSLSRPRRGRPGRSRTPPTIVKV